MPPAITARGEGVVGDRGGESGTLAPLYGYWQGMLEFGEGRGWLKLDMVFGHGRRLVPPDTASEVDVRNAVVWETISSQLTGPGVGRFCEVLSFNSHAQVHVPYMEEAAKEPNRASVVTPTPGEVCGIFNRTGSDLMVAWASGGHGAYPMDFQASAKTHVARLRLLTTDLYPPELEGMWSGSQLLATGEGEEVSQVIKVPKPGMPPPVPNHHFLP